MKISTFSSVLYSLQGSLWFSYCLVEFLGESSPCQNSSKIHEIITLYAIIEWYLYSKFYNHVIFFVGLKSLGTFIKSWLDISKGNFVYYHWGCTSNYLPLSYPSRSMIIMITILPLLSASDIFGRFFISPQFSLEISSIIIIKNIFKRYKWGKLNLILILKIRQKKAKPAGYTKTLKAQLILSLISWCNKKVLAIEICHFFTLLDVSSCKEVGFITL